MEIAEFDANVADLEVRLERLRSLYQQYFLGFEKMPPGVVHKDVERRFQTLRKVQLRNTARAFKLHTLIQRYNTYQQYWRRICRQIEEGTYQRHILRMERQREDREVPAGAIAPLQEDMPELPDLSDGVTATSRLEAELSALLAKDVPMKDELQAVMDELGPLSLPPTLSVKPPPLPPRRRPRSIESMPAQAAAPSYDGTLTDRRVAELSQELGAAKTRLNQVSAVSAESLAKKLRATEQELRGKHAGKVIDFKVVIKDGKAIVRPVIR